MLKLLSTRSDKNMLDALKPHGINIQQFRILMTLLEQDGLTQSAIGKKILMPGYAITRNIDTLARLGLLERQEHQTSRRSFCIRLTKKGRSLAPMLFAIVKKMNKSTLSQLDEKEIAQLKRLLAKMLP